MEQNPNLDPELTKLIVGAIVTVVTAGLRWLELRFLRKTGKTWDGQRVFKRADDNNDQSAG